MRILTVFISAFHGTALFARLVSKGVFVLQQCTTFQSIQSILSLSLSPIPLPLCAIREDVFILSGLLVLVGAGRAGIGREFISCGGALI